jgi:hypothetical protein
MKDRQLLEAHYAILRQLLVTAIREGRKDLISESQFFLLHWILQKPLSDMPPEKRTTYERYFLAEMVSLEREVLSY